MAVPIEDEAISIEPVVDDTTAPSRTSELASSRESLAKRELQKPSAAHSMESAAASVNDSPVIIAPPLDSSLPLVRPLPENVNDGSWTFRQTRDVDLKLGDKTARLGREMAAHGTLELPPPSSPAGLSEELDAADVEHGFGRGGGIVQAIEDVVRDPSAPPEGVAFFEVAIEKSGKISVNVSDATANREDWERLSNAIAAAVKTKNVRFPDQANGLRIGVRVEAKVRFPDGRDPKKSGAFAKGTGLKTHTDKNGLVLDELPSASIGTRGKVCSAAVSITMLGPAITGGCSPENIGTHPERTVAAREVYEKRM